MLGQPMIHQVVAKSFIESCPWQANSTVPNRPLVNDLEDNPPTLPLGMSRPVLGGIPDGVPH